MANKKKQSVSPIADTRRTSDFAHIDFVSKWFLWFFWFLALLAIIGGDCFFGAIKSNRAIWAIVVGTLGYGILILFVHKFEKMRLGAYCIMIALLGFGMLFLAGDYLIPTTLFLMFITVISSILSCLALYYERFGVDNILQWPLAHNRYLEYLKQAIWLIGFVLVGFVAWTIQRALLYIQSSHTHKL